MAQLGKQKMTHSKCSHHCPKSVIKRKLELVMSQKKNYTNFIKNIISFFSTISQGPSDGAPPAVNWPYKISSIKTIKFIKQKKWRKRNRIYDKKKKKLLVTKQSLKTLKQQWNI